MLQLVQDLRGGAVTVVEVPDPVPGDGQVLVRNRWSLISPGTEQALAETAAKGLLGKVRDRPEQARAVVDKARKEGVGPTLAAVRARLDDVLTPGYSSSGVVEALGPGTTGLTVGDRVSCVGANIACHAERIVVPAPLCSKLPDGLEDRWGAFGALGGIAAHGVRVAEVSAGALVVVVGLGLVGQLAAQLVTAAGARAIGVDVSRPRAELSRSLGAVAAAAIGDDDVEELVRGLSQGHGADAVIVAAAAKDSGPLRLAATVARDRATIAVVGDVGLEVPRRSFYEKELQLRVSRSYGPGRYDPSYERDGHDYPIGYVRWTERRLIAYFLEEVKRGSIRLGDLVSHEVPIEKGEDAYEALSEPGRMAILLRYDAPAAPTRRTTFGTGHARVSHRPRAALIGTGLFARSTLLPLLRDTEVELVATVATTPARARSTARRWGASYAAAQADEVLQDDSVDIVFIATRHDSHADLAARALDAGKAVFLEKPLAVDEQGLASIEGQLRAGGSLVVDFNRSLASATASVRKHWGDRGEPLHIHYRVNAGFLEEGHWLRDRSSGGGRLVGEACHFVDACGAIVDRPLASIQVTPLGSGPGTLPGDNFVLTLCYADGSVATISYIASGSVRMDKERIEVLGAGRSAVIDDYRAVQLHPKRRRHDRAGLIRRQDKGHADTLAAALRFFREGGQPPIPYERLIETTRATLLARDALDNGRRSPVPLLSP